MYFVRFVFGARYTSYRTNSYARYIVNNTIIPTYFPKYSQDLPLIDSWLEKEARLDCKYETDLQDEYGTHSSLVSYIFARRID